jgi:GntR family transcriptional regulator of arabinose operon
MQKTLKDQPLYIQIYQALKQRIEGGEWSFGAMLPSEHELAELYGISRGTLRQVLAKLEEEGLVSRERGRGTFMALPGVRNSAIGLNNDSISFIVPYVRDSYVSSILLGLESIARANGYAVIFQHVENDIDKQELALRKAVQQGVSGIVLYPVNSDFTSPIFSELIQKRYPLVLVDRYIRGLYTDYVISDNFGGGLCATQYLLSMGHRRIVFLSWEETAITMEHRRLGYRQAFIEAGIEPDPDLEWEVVGYPEIDKSALCARLMQIEQPAAIFAANDQLALAVQQAARSLGLSIPGDLALVGFDNLDISAHLDIPLTTIAQSAFDIGSTAGELILYQMKKELGCTQRRILPVQLIVRSSCGANPTEEQDYRKNRKEVIGTQN